MPDPPDATKSRGGHGYGSRCSAPSSHGDQRRHLPNRSNRAVTRSEYARKRVHSRARTTIAASSASRGSRLYVGQPCHRGLRT
jgi:hypothetical protein